MNGKFKEWIIHKKLDEARGNPLKKLKDIENDNNNYMIMCDWLQDRGYDEKPLDKQNLAYIKPLSNNLNIILEKRFPHMTILRRGRGAMSARIYYTLFNRELLEKACEFLHISPVQHVIDSPYLTDWDFIRQFDSKRLKEISQAVYKSHPELFQGPLSGRHSLPRASIDVHGLWDYDQYHALKQAIPGEDMRNGMVYNRQGLLAIMQVVANEINAKWETKLKPEYMIE